MIISYKHGRGNKIHLYLDDEYKITTTETCWADNFIKDGSDISEEEWNELVRKINYSKALKKCYDLLAVRSHSVKELTDKLRRSFDEETVNKVVDLMLEYGYLNDEDFARELLDYLMNDKKKSKSHIIYEMRKRGISSEIYENLISDADIDDIGVAYDIICSKYLNKLSQEGGRQKVIAAMMRKGFSYSTVLCALERIENDDEF